LFARVIAVSVILLAASPAFAQHGGAQIPEPGDAALFIVAVVGLIIGRHVSRRAPRHDDDTQV
jgi:hypothetical protein